MTLSLVKIRALPDDIPSAIIDGCSLVVAEIEYHSDREIVTECSLPLTVLDLDRLAHGVAGIEDFDTDGKFSDAYSDDDWMESEVLEGDEWMELLNRFCESSEDDIL